jgi:hypothetical protein
MAGPKCPAILRLGMPSTGPEDAEGRHNPIVPIVEPVEEGARMSTAVSPLAPTDVPDMPAIAGVRLATAAAGIRYKGRTDVLLAVMDKGTTVAGVFTQSKCPSAPVEWCRAKLGPGKARAGGEFRQRQRLHRQDRAAVDGADGLDRLESGRLQRQ